MNRGRMDPVETRGAGGRRLLVTRVARSWPTLSIAVALAAIGLTGCGGDFHMSTSDLDISPNPAVPGDIVTATFLLSLIPAQSHTIVVVIDDAEHMRVNSNAAPPIPVVLELGDAADLIATYGTGQHAAHIVVHANDDMTRTQSVTFQLNDAAPQESHAPATDLGRGPGT